MIRFFAAVCMLCLFSFQAAAKEGELIVALEDWPSSFNPALQSGTIVFSIGAQLFSGLTMLDKNGEAVPYLAKKWELSSDKKTYTFYLHENAYFHDNTQITADDVVFSINFSRKNHPFFPFLEHIDSVKKISEYCLEIRLKYPMERFPSFLLPIFVPILPQYYYSFTSLEFPVVGSGPFRIVSYEENSTISLERFDKFFLRDKPKLERLTYKIYFDFYEIFYALKNNDVDMFMFYSCNGVSSYLDKFALEQFSVFPIDMIYPYMVITYNMRKPLFQDIRVRRALSLALDKEKLASYFESRSVKPVNGGIPATNEYYVPVGDVCDVELANALLDEAGYYRDNTGKRFSITMDYLAYSYMSEIIHWIQREWSKKLGIELQSGLMAGIQEGEAQLTPEGVQGVAQVLIGLGAVRVFPKQADHRASLRLPFRQQVIEQSLHLLIGKMQFNAVQQNPWALEQIHLKERHGIHSLTKQNGEEAYRMSPRNR